jgi:hypothetical protein
LQLTPVTREHAMRHLERDYVHEPASDVWYHPGVSLAVAQVLGEVSAQHGFWAMRRRGVGWEGVALPRVDPATAAIPAHLREETIPRLVLADCAGYNVVQYRGRYFALAQSLGTVDLPRLSAVRLKEFERAGALVAAGSLEEARRGVDSAAGPPRTPGQVRPAARSVPR